MTLISTELVLLFTSIVSGYAPRNSTAEINQIQGCYIFIDSKPVKEYKYLGTVKVGLTWVSGPYQDVRDALIRKIKKNTPTPMGLFSTFMMEEWMPAMQ